MIHLQAVSNFELKYKIQMKSHQNKVLFFLFCFIILCSCNKNGKFRVEGKIDNAPGEFIYLEKREHAEVKTLDSLKLDKDGDFKFEQIALGYPEFYKIRVGNQNVNFVIDSTETITIRGDYKNLSTGYEIEGSEGSKTMKAMNNNLYDLYRNIEHLEEAYNKGQLTNLAFNDSVVAIFARYKKQVKSLILYDFRNPAGYYALFLRYNNEQILNP